MEAQLLLSFSASTHLSLHIWDLIWRLLCHRPWPSFISSSPSLNAATQHGLDRTKLLSLLFCLLTFFLQPHVRHIMFILPHYLSYVLSISTSMLTVLSQITPHFSTAPPASFPLSLIMSHVTFPLTPLSLSLLFSVWQLHWKVRPCHFKDGTAQELSMNAAWGTGLVHALQHGGILVHGEHCRRCWAGLGFSWNRKPLKLLLCYFQKISISIDLSVLISVA